jgi:hypothetical protein
MNENYSLSEETNFYKYFDNTPEYYFSTYYAIINKYMAYISKNIMVQNEEYYKYIIKKGVELIGHIYKFLLMYTKNLDLTVHHTQKGYYYFVEFVGQISNEHNSFLNLNLKDAILFVYRKTIFNISEDFTKNFKLTMSEKNDLLILNNRVSCVEMYYNLLLEYYFNNNSENNEKNIKKFQNIIECIVNSFDEDLININSVQHKIYKKLLLLCFENNISLSKCEKLVLKLSKKDINEDNEQNILNNLFMFDIHEKIQLLTPQKLVNFIST